LESGVRTRGALDGLGYALANIAPLHLMCDRNDLGVYIARAEFAAGLSRRESISNSVQPPFGELPAICLYEQIAAGLGFSLRLYELHDQLMLAAHQLIADCPCHNGCPACVGPVFDNPLAQLDTKRLTLALAEALSEGAAGL
jgi:DEAD/DEAH box helicase domain-containing protein